MKTRLKIVLWVTATSLLLNPVATIPEPATAVLALLGVGMLARRRR